MVLHASIKARAAGSNVAPRRSRPQLVVAQGLAAPAARMRPCSNPTALLQTHEWPTPLAGGLRADRGNHLGHHAGPLHHRILGSSGASFSSVSPAAVAPGGGTATIPPALQEGAPMLISEDDDLLVVDKPRGWASSVPDPHQGYGVLEWLQQREPRWRGLKCPWKLPAGDSGAMVLAKTARAAEALSSAGRPREDRAGGGRSRVSGVEVLHPLTGKPVRFDAPPPPPAAAAPGGGGPALAAARATCWPGETDCCRAWRGSGPAVNESGDALGPAFLLQTEQDASAGAGAWEGAAPLGGRAVGSVYLKALRRDPGAGGSSSPRLVAGAPHPDDAGGKFAVEENGLRFLLSMEEGYSVGLFLDQRDNRRSLLRGSLGGPRGFGLGGAAGGGAWWRSDGRPEALNLFAYTCAFSVCAAAGGGARTTSVDLSKKYLDWGRANFEANGIDPAEHDFIYGDCFEWLQYFLRKERLFDLVLIDPPTFSRSKSKKRKKGVPKTFSALKDYGKLAADAMRVVAPGGALLCSTNAAKLPPRDFEGMVDAAARAVGRRVEARCYVPQPPDFSAGGQPLYLKTLWVRLD